MSSVYSPSNSSTLPTQDYDTSYYCPSIYTLEGIRKDRRRLDDELQSWIREVVQEGVTFVRNSRTYDDITRAIDIICGTLHQERRIQLSNIQINNIKRNIREMSAILSNIRPSWLYEANSTKYESWLKQAKIQNGLSKEWYETGFIDRELRKLIQTSLVEAIAYVSPVWTPDLFGFRNGGIELRHYRYNEVLPIQIGKDFNLQRAYATIMIDEMPINRARELFPNKVHELKADRGEYKLARNRMAKAAVGFFDAIMGADQGTNRKTYPSPVIDILYIYVNDFSINRTPYPIPMGDGSYSYIVPYLGQEIPVTPRQYNSQGVVTRPARVEDCRLYPYKRLIIATKTCILYDGPNYYWHGKTPIVKYSPDEWFFSYLPFSIAAEAFTLNESSNSMRRDVEDALKLKIDPPTAVDEISMSKTQAESNSLRMPGKRIRGKLGMGEFIKSVLPPEAYNVGADHFGYIAEVEEKIAWLMGLPDLKALQKAKQVPSSESIEKFFSEAGEIVTDMSRSMDKPMWEIADMNRYYFLQFYDLNKRIKILGQDGLTEEDFDFEPGTLIPTSFENEPLLGNGTYESTQMERARAHCLNFKTSIEPTSLHMISHMKKKLIMMQAKKLDPMLISTETLAKNLDIKNWGTSDGDTEVEKTLNEVQLQQKIQLDFQIQQAKVQLAIQMMAAMNSPEGQIAGALQQAVGGLLGEEQNNIGGNGNHVGRPNEFKKAPELEQKSDGRTTMTTS